MRIGARVIVDQVLPLRLSGFRSVGSGSNPNANCRPGACGVVDGDYAEGCFKIRHDDGSVCRYLAEELLPLTPELMRRFVVDVGTN